MTNPFATLIESLSTEQRKLLMEALGVDGAAQLTPTKKRPVKKVPAKKAIVKKTVVKKAPVKKKVGRPTQEDFTTSTRADGGLGSKRQPVKFKANEWKDTGEERNAKTRPPKKKKLIPSPRTRPAYEEVEQVCRICNRKFKVPASIAGGEFRTAPRCDKCTG